MNRVDIRNGRSPFEYALVSVTAASGLLGVSLPAPGPSANIQRAFGEQTPIFYMVLLLSAVTVLIGASWPRPTVQALMTGMRIERIGLLPLGGGCAAYAAANVVISRNAAIISAMLIGGIAAAAWIRARIITTDLRKLNSLLLLGPEQQDQGETEDGQAGGTEP